MLYILEYENMKKNEKKKKKPEKFCLFTFLIYVDLYFSHLNMHKKYILLFEKYRTAI